LSSEDVQSLAGFREFFPAEFALRQHIFAAWRRVAARYGFVEYDGPPLEPLELYTRKSGEEIVGQLYSFTDRGGREVALRPEMTPSFARMISARAGGLPKPIRWFSIPQLFRFERPQRGRLREHFQLNMDIVGESDPLADAEIIAAALDALRELGLDETHIVARVSDRRLVSAILTAEGVSDDRHLAVYAVLDKADRETPEWLSERLEAATIEEGTRARLLELPTLGLEEVRLRYARDEAILAAADSLDLVLSHLGSAGFGDYARFDAGLVRGLAYYTGTVFEIWERSGDLRAVCGGGRYDDLLASLGGVDLPALGFGMGDVVLAELLRDLELAPDATLEIDDFIVCVSDDQRGTALAVGAALRRQDRRVIYDLRERGVGRQFKTANQLGAARAIVVGPDDVARGVVVTKDMSSGDTGEIELGELLDGPDE